jgi:hypothetical protein
MEKSMEFKVVEYKVERNIIYDIFICSMGFERRSSYIPSIVSNSSKLKIVFDFEDDDILSYNYNRKVLEKMKFEILSVEKYYSIEKIVNQNRISGLQSKIYIAIDISTMTRKLMSKVLFEIMKISQKIEIRLDILYTPAKYLPPQRNANPISVFEPIIPELAGWSSDPEIPLAAIIGLCYEYERALGVIEYLEASPVYAYEPYGIDKRYDSAMIKANSGLKSIIPQNRFMKYSVDRPYELFINLESLVYGLMAKNRVVIIPLGPKIFSVISILIGLIHYNNLSIWRVSEEYTLEPIDRIASRKIIGITVNSKCK